MSTSNNGYIYYNLFAVMLIFAGTVGIFITSYGLKEFTRILSIFRLAFRKPDIEHSGAVDELLHVIKDCRMDPELLSQALSRVRYPFTQDALKLIISGIPSNEVVDIMRESIASKEDRESSDANMIRTIGKFPPALGITGTLIGLIALL